MRGLDRLTGFPYLNSLGMQGNPIVEEKGDGFKTEVLIATNERVKIKKINKEEVTEDDHAAANNEREERKKAEEEARLERERKALEGGDEEEKPPEDE